MFTYCDFTTPITYGRGYGERKSFTIIYYYPILNNNIDWDDNHIHWDTVLKWCDELIRNLMYFGTKWRPDRRHIRTRAPIKRAVGRDDKRLPACNSGDHSQSILSWSFTLQSIFEYIASNNRGGSNWFLLWCDVGDVQVY